MKKRIFAILTITICWMICDFVIHGIFLAAEYAATGQLWIPPADMNPLYNNAILLIISIVFVGMYCRFVSQKSIHRAVRFGLAVGLLTGVGFGLGSYGWMPITLTIAISWFVAQLLKFAIAGGIAGYFVKD